MLKPLKEYICDSCGQLIQKPEQGEVIWKVTYKKPYLNYDYKIVHMRRVDNPCSMGDYDCNTNLKDFVDQYILHPYAVNLQEYMDTMRRLTVPYYEEARQYLKNPFKTMRHFENDFADEMIPWAEFFKMVIEVNED
ncbi:MAG: hypothetical protein H6551_13065 [Chitinophagales bacterium]|nr:hypothetical protein [Chitinophagaceae bacterium]MCB9066063.1 hypothetical protein [Chitinophagales bacterium]